MNLDFDINTIAVAVVAVAIAHFLYSQYVDATRDISDVYLSQQSTINPIRQPNESPIYKSNKLDYANGLRVGLDIRYDHYKLRNGNLCDVWEVLVNQLKSHPDKSITIGSVSLPVSKINSRVHKLGNYLTEGSYSRVAIHYSLFLSSMDAFMVVMAAFINQITVQVYDTSSFDDASVLVVTGLAQPARLAPNSLVLGSDSFNAIVGDENLSSFANEYHFSKDRGIALQLTTKVNSSLVNNVYFTQGNLISSVASTLKHLPLTQSMTENDTLLVVQGRTFNNENLLNELVKILSTFVSGTNLVVAREPSVETIRTIDPSIISISEKDFVRTVPLKSLLGQVRWFDRLFYAQSLTFLSKGKFSNHMIDHPTLSKSLRLLYLHKPLADNVSVSSGDLNCYRALLNLRLIVELGYPNIVGPFLLTDYYDYRILPVYANFKGSGCISQSNEIKLIDYDQSSPDGGQILVRGYNIGKFNNQGLEAEKEIPSLDNDGFMPVPDLKAKWGNDGCLYVYK